MMNVKNMTCLATTILLLVCSVSAFSLTSYTQFGRYLTVTNAPHGSNPYGVDSIVQRQFPENIQTIGEAVKLTLEGTGYHMLSVDASPEVINHLYSYPLPVYLRNIGPMSLKNALLKLSGKTYQLVVDPVHRLVTYKLRHDYKSL